MYYFKSSLVDADCTAILRIRFFGNLQKDYPVNLKNLKKCGQAPLTPDEIEEISEAHGSTPDFFSGENWDEWHLGIKIGVIAGGIIGCIVIITIFVVLVLKSKRSFSPEDQIPMQNHSPTYLTPKRKEEIYSMPTH